jgi:lipopolysaccharide transport protein LptA
MAVSFPKLLKFAAYRWLALRFAGVLVLLAGSVGAAVSQQLPITLDAASSEFDRRAGRLSFREVRIEQGQMVITAALAQADELDFARSKWRFTGDVHIETGMGTIDAGEAELTFVDHELREAEALGEPARFSRQMPEADGRLVTGTAGTISYDTREGEIVLAGNATVRDGLREVSGGRLLYRLAEDRLIASSDESGQERVRIVIAPPAESGNSGAEAPPEAPQDAGDRDPAE